MRSAIATFLSLATLALAVIVDNDSTASYNASAEINKLPACPTTRNQAYDYIIVGAGPGGGPLAARLALDGFKVLLIDAGRDYVGLNTTIPLYLARATEDPEIALDYYVDHYPTSDSRNSKVWYPRSQGLGGSAIHNALINQIPHKWDFEQIKSLFGDDSWSADNMQKLYTRIEKNLYIPPDIGTPLGHGYTGWLETQAPATNLITDPQYADQQLVDLISGVQNAVLPVPGTDWTTTQNDLAEGGGVVILTKNANNTRSSIRDHLVKSQSFNKNALVFQLSTLATKILTCRTSSGRVRAYGVSAAVGGILPVSRKFTGKKTLTLTNFYAKNEIIISAGAYQTPQLLMLSGIGDPAQLKQYSVPSLVNLPGVGQNLQDRLEMTIVWQLKTPHVIWKGCTFGPSPATDPCLAAWYSSGHTNLYQAGPAIYAHSYKSSPDLPYRDVWSMFGPGSFRGYKPGWSNEIANVNNAWVDVILKAHTDAKGYVKLTGNHIQDLLNINKNQGQTDGFKKDVEIIKDEILRSRALVANTPSMNQHIVQETWPGPSVSTDAQINSFIEKNGWGHHNCCTSKMGLAKDKLSVINNNFQVYGVENLRVVDNSAWPNIPGMFVTTPIYILSEKASDVVKAYAKSQGWTPTYAAVAK